MDNRINRYQQRLFYKLFATFSSVRKANEFCDGLDIDVDIDSFYYVKNKDLWFTRGQQKDKYLYFFGLKDKLIKDISGEDTRIIIDFDKNTQFNDKCLGLFCTKNFEIHILINYNILKKRYPYIFNFGFKRTNFKSEDGSVELEVIDLGSLDDFIDNIEKFISFSSFIKPPSNSTFKSRELENTNKINIELKNKFDNVLNELKNGKDLSQINTVSVNEISEWLNKGKQRESPYDYFYEQYDSLIENEIKEYENNEINRKIFLENLKSGKTKEESAKNGDIELSLICKWYSKGSNNEKPYVEFYDKYSEIIDEKKPQIPKLAKTDSLGNKNTIAQMNMILEYLAMGKSEDEAIKNAKVSKNTYKYWLNRGKQEFGELYIQFYCYVTQFMQEISDDEDEELEEDIPNDIQIDQGIYAPLPEKYEKSFNSMNQSGIAWVNQIGSKFYYVKARNGKNVRLCGDNIPELYEKVKNANQIWGIRDYDRAKEFIDFPDDFEVPLKPQFEEAAPVRIEVDPGIYAPLPEKYEKSFNSSPNNRTGIAWVNFVGKKWVYSKSVNGKTIKIDDENIYGLYGKVKFKNQIWGIRDYDKAKEFIDFPDDFEAPLKPRSEEDAGGNVEIDQDIYAPLSPEYEQQFSSSPNNRTGIAWVNYVGKKWVYQRNINRKKVYFADENIYLLHQKVKENNLSWGIKDYAKARKFIDIPDDYIIPEVYEEPIEISHDIFAPLPDKYLSSFNPSQKNKTGIAWVNQIGNKYVYQRTDNGVKFKFSDVNIRKLHKTVLENNQIWGIIDFDKAMPIIESSKIETNEGPEVSEPQISTKPINKSEVVVNYIEKPMNELDVIIKGVIRTRDIIDVLNRLNLFKEDIKRIISTSKDNEADIFIELEINKYMKNSFEEKIQDLGWEINK